ncbi:MAG: Ig-like domain-containing protein, partial [Lachnospiraceae bacterium]|nr:Ig-like domain-containing protein [Lachnospiraceae bacterium]
MKRSRFISLLLAGMLGVTSISFPAEVFGSELDNEVIEVLEEDKEPQAEVVVEAEESVDNATEEAVSEDEVVDKDGEEDNWLQVELTKGGWAIPHFDPANVPEYAISGHFTYQLCVRYEDGTKEGLMYFYRDGIDKLEPARFHQGYLDWVNKSGKLFCYIGVKDGETKHRFDSNYIDYTVPSTRLASPVNIRAFDIDGRKIIAWDEVPGSDGYFVDVYRDGYDRDKNIPNEIDECSFDLTPILEKYKCGGCELEITANSGDVTQIRCSMPSTFITSDFSLDQDEMRLATGKMKTIKPVFSGTERSLIWTSTDPSVASVDQSGNVTAVGAGEAIISARIQSGVESTNSCIVTVYDQIKSLKLDPSSKTIGTGDEFVLKADVGAYTVTNSTIITTTGSTVVAGPAVSFKSSDESLITVTPYGEGKVIVKAASSIGDKTSESAKVIVETTDGSAKTAECNVTINAKDLRVALKKLGLNVTSITLNNGKVFRLLPVMTPSNASVTEVNYDYGDENSKNYIEINGRYITAKELPKSVSKANAKVKVTAKDAFGTVKEAFCTVTVVNSEIKVSKITLSQNKISMGSDAVAYIKYDIAPAWADDRSIKWSLSENDIVEWNDEGDGYVWITAKKAGTVKVTGTAQDGSNKSATCTITVGNPVESVTIVKDKIPAQLQVGKTLKLKANVNGSGSKPANTAVTWRSSDKAVATVDKTGK